jgi:DNA-binding NarL/FixJ family response regulator
VTLFIADDSDLVRERLSTLLSQLDNVEVVGHAGTVQNAIGGIQRLKPDVVVLDMKMPGGCGIDVLEHIKRGGSGPVVIMLTNYPYPQYEHRCIDAGADFFFDKSREFELAVQAIERLASEQVQEK